MTHVHREFPGNPESTNLSGDFLSRDIGRRTISFHGTKSGGGEQSLMLDCRAKVRVKSFFCFSLTQALHAPCLSPSLSLSVGLH